MPPEKCKHCECYRGIGDRSSIITTCGNSPSFAASEDRCSLHWYVMQPGQPCKICHSLTCGWHALDSKASALLTSLTVCVLVLQRIVLRVLNIQCLLAVAVRVVLGMTVLETIFALRLQVSSFICHFFFFSTTCLMPLYWDCDVHDSFWFQICYIIAMLWCCILAASWPLIELHPVPLHVYHDS